MPDVNEEAIGHRAISLLSQGLCRLVDAIEPNQAALLALIQQAVANEFQVACEPGGAVSNAIGAACQPGGAVSNAIGAACEPGGAVANAIDAACGPNGPIILRIREEMNANIRQVSARQHNGQCVSPQDHLSPVPNQDGDYPPNFPTTVQNLRTLNAARVDELSTFYQIPILGYLPERRQKLASHLNVSI
jgi:hypothetical protein